MTLIKICGIRELEHARVAAAAGASLIGLVFVPVRREIKLEAAREIVATVHHEFTRSPAAIGLFVNETAETINTTVETVGLDLVQLHGDETPELARAIEVPVIKALRLESTATVSEVRTSIEQYLNYCAGVLIDSHVPGQWGGTGVVGDWTAAAELAGDYPIVLAGGLSPENVSDAIERVCPAVVDVSSGVETDGRKDSAKIRAFVQRVGETAGSIERPSAAQPLAEVIDSVRERHHQPDLPARTEIH